MVCTLYRRLDFSDSPSDQLIYYDRNGTYSYLLHYVEDNLQFIQHRRTPHNIYYNLSSLLQNLTTTESDSTLINILNEFGIHVDQLSSIDPSIYVTFNTTPTLTGIELSIDYYQVDLSQNSKLKKSPLTSLSIMFYNELSH